jgi:methyl-accepting chemotaxis protein|tara:strand:+ start:6635 stop:6913 length:279 start_codon:yes stop_codon:yes gene_type:complete
MQTNKILKKNIKLFALATIISLSGCAVVSQEMVNEVQITAKKALDTADAANKRAENSESVAKAAQNAAKNISYDYEEITERMKRMFQEVQEK